jgi:hypothetical protein
MGIAAYNRGSRAISAGIDREAARTRYGRYCTGKMWNGPGKQYARCLKCGDIDYEKYEGDRCGKLIVSSQSPAGSFAVRSRSGRVVRRFATKREAEAFVRVQGSPRQDQPAFVTLAAVPNRDYENDTRRASKLHVPVSSYAEASRICSDFIQKHGLGSGNWMGGTITDARGKIVGKVSYNGRVWPPGKWVPGMKPLWPTDSNSPSDRTRKAIREVQPALRDIGVRLAQGEANFIEILMARGGISKADAEKVYQVFRKLKVVKRDVSSGVISVKHGGLLDREIILRALEQS